MISVSTFSELGGHEENEDAYRVCAHPDDDSVLLCAIADGQGGRAGGALASQAACKICIDLASQYSPRKLLKARAWREVCQSADRAVEGTSMAGFTTLVALCVAGSQMCGASSGDSAAMLFTANNEHQTLTDNQLKNPPVGSGAARFVDFSSKLLVPWKVLMMTDGVWKYAGWQGIIDIAASSEGDEMTRALRERAALPRTGQLQDDFTTVILASDET